MCIVMLKWLLAATTVLFAGIPAAAEDAVEGVEESLDRRGRQLLMKLEPENSAACQLVTAAEWLYATNITDHNQKIMLDARLKHAEFVKDRWKKINEIDWHSIEDPDMKRQYKYLSKLGSAALPEHELKKYGEIQSGLVSTYSTAKICDLKENCNLSLEPDLTEIMATSRDPELLEHVWLSWRNNTGRKMKKDYQEFVQMLNRVANLNDYTDATEMWLSKYDTADFRQQLSKLWQQLNPLYGQLHAYVRGRLRAVYGDGVVSKDGPIPAHLLGNMWAQSWSNVLDICKPYPQKTSVDVTPQMKEQGYTAERMFRLSDEFFSSLGLVPMTAQFWNGSILEKPADGRDLVCHASAWDFCDGNDVRIKQCTRINMEDLITVHHEMGHIEYYLQYRDQPYVYRTGANPGFHEAVGDTLALSVATPKHLKEIGLLEEVVKDPEVDMNFLMSTALEKIAFLPFGYLMDKWRWDLFSGQTPAEEMNCAWWKMRRDVQGVQPPQVRSEEDFDPGSKIHISANVPYVRYFVSFIIQFQFHRALCIAAGQYSPDDSSRPLHQCDIYKSRDAGTKLADMLKMGFSKPWPEAMEAITGQREMDATALRDYFRPLEEWLTMENQRNNEQVGWTKDKEVCVDGSLATTRSGADAGGDTSAAAGYSRPSHR